MTIFEDLTKTLIEIFPDFYEDCSPTVEYDHGRETIFMYATPTLELIKPIIDQLFGEREAMKIGGEVAIPFPAKELINHFAHTVVEEIDSWKQSQSYAAIKLLGFSFADTGRALNVDRAVIHVNFT